MSGEALHESLSAVMDNAADELELRRVLAASDDSAELKATWLRYQVARAAMHRELLDPKLDLASAVSVAIAEETTPTARIARFSWRAGFGQVAIAASVTMAVLAGVRFYNSQSVDVMERPAMAGQALQPSLSFPSDPPRSAVLAGYEKTGSKTDKVIDGDSTEAAFWHEQRLPAYMRQHVLRTGYTPVESDVVDDKQQ